MRCLGSAYRNRSNPAVCPRLGPGCSHAGFDGLLRSLNLGAQQPFKVRVRGACYPATPWVRPQPRLCPERASLVGATFAPVPSVVALPPRARGRARARAPQQPLSSLASLLADAFIKHDNAAQAALWYRRAVELDVYNVHVRGCFGALPYTVLCPWLYAVKSARLWRIGVLLLCECTRCCVARWACVNGAVCPGRPGV